MRDRRAIGGPTHEMVRARPVMSRLMFGDRWLVLGAIVIGLGVGWVASATGDPSSVGGGAIRPLTDRVRGSSVSVEGVSWQDDLAHRRVASLESSPRQQPKRDGKKQQGKKGSGGKHEKKRPHGASQPSLAFAPDTDGANSGVVVATGGTSPVTSGSTGGTDTSPSGSGGTGGSGGSGGTGGSGGSGGTGGSGGSGGTGGSGGSGGTGTGGPDGDGGGGGGGGTDDGSGGTVGGGGGG